MLPSGLVVMRSPSDELWGIRGEGGRVFGLWYILFKYIRIPDKMLCNSNLFHFAEHIIPKVRIDNFRFAINYFFKICAYTKIFFISV